jgi:signal transduction histidine kinase
MATSDISSLAGAVPAPAPHWHDTEPTGHVVQFYSDDSFLIDALSKFVGTALGAGDSAVVIATQIHRDALAQRLRARGLDIVKSARGGRYVVLDAAHTLSKFMRDGQPDPELFVGTVGDTVARASAAAEGNNPRVAAFGEMVAILWAEGNADGAIKLEQLWNDLASTHSFSLRCAYPLAGFSDQTHAEPFLKICSEHSAVIPAENYTALGTEQDRLRNIAQLQQKAEALETEKALLQALRHTKEQLEKEVAERREAQRKLCNSELSLRALSGHLLRTQDEERRRLGRELHDSVGQYLAVLKIGLDTLSAQAALPDQDARRRIADCLHMAEQSIKEVRTISYLLYPPMLEEMGLKTAIPWYIDGFAKRSGIEITLDICPDLRRLPRDVELAAFRVVQESLTNVHRHSGSATAHIRVHMEDVSLSLQVRDAGKGIPADVLEASRDCLATLGVGLRGMNERVRQLGGSFQLLSDESGTTVRASIPCEVTSCRP